MTFVHQEKREYAGLPRDAERLILLVHRVAELIGAEEPTIGGDLAWTNVSADLSSLSDLEHKLRAQDFGSLSGLIYISGSPSKTSVFLRINWLRVPMAFDVRGPDEVHVKGVAVVLDDVCRAAVEDGERYRAEIAEKVREAESSGEPANQRLLATIPSRAPVQGRSWIREHGLVLIKYVLAPVVAGVILAYVFGIGID